MKKLFNTIKNDPLKTKGALLVLSTVLANIFNFLYNAYLGRSISLEDFALISLIGSIMSISDIPINALNRTVVYKSAYLLGRYNLPAKEFFVYLKKRIILVSLIISAFWLVLSPLIAHFFRVDSILPIIAFTPVWIFTIMSAVNGGYLSGNFRFGYLAATFALEAISKFVIAVIFIRLGFGEYVYFAITISSFLTFATLMMATKNIKASKKSIKNTEKIFPIKFYLSSAMTRISSASYLTADVLLAKHFLSSKEAGEYALLSLTGKMIYFAGSLFSQFLVPVVSHKEGSGKKSEKAFYQILLATTASCLLAFSIIGMLGNITVPLLFGKNAYPILPYIFWYTLSMAAFTVSTNIVNLHQIKGKGVIPTLSVILASIQILGISTFSNSVASISMVMVVLGFTSLATVLMAHVLEAQIKTISVNIRDFIELFLPIRRQKSAKGLRILIFNWRDLEHKWAGGAEVYVHELAKRFVKKGNTVTVFCGNDRRSPRNQTIDGVKIIRRGGFYTVYLWAALYYIFKFRKNYDVVIDSENGIPFFTPLFSTKPVILLIHHVHQEVFIQYMKFPFSYLAKFIEGKIMPLVYRNRTVVTVSESTKQEIIKAKIAKEKNIEIISPGIDFRKYKSVKTKFPSFVYLGRLKPYKNVDVAIQAFAKVLESYRNAKFFIVGDGESLSSLVNLSEQLKIGQKVLFMGRVSEKKKINTIAKSWIALQPSTVEGWGITVIEANMCATPVIASNTNGLRDSIVHGKTGILVETGNVGKFAKQMDMLIRNKKKRIVLSRNAVAWAKQLSWDESINRFSTLIDSEVTDRKPRFSLQNLSYIVNSFTSLF